MTNFRSKAIEGMKTTLAESIAYTEDPFGLLDSEEIPELPTLARSRGLCVCCQSETMVREHLAPAVLAQSDTPYMLCDVCVSIGADRANIPLEYTPTDAKGHPTGATILHYEPDARVLKAIAYGINMQLESLNLIGESLHAIYTEQAAIARNIQNNVEAHISDQEKRTRAHTEKHASELGELHKTVGDIANRLQTVHEEMHERFGQSNLELHRSHGELTQRLDEIDDDLTASKATPTEIIFGGVTDAGVESLAKMFQELSLQTMPPAAPGEYRNPKLDRNRPVNPR